MVKGYKASNVGTIPEDWDCVCLLDKCQLLNGLTYTPNNVVENGLLVLRASNVQNSELFFDDNVYVDCEVDEEHLIHKNDIVICVRNGSKTLLGKCAISKYDYNATFGAFMAVLRGLDNTFIFQLFQRGNIQKDIIRKSEATINQITNKDFKSLMIPYPPNFEERTLISNAFSDIDELIYSLEMLIKKKKAIRKGAIQELITGKKRLQGFFSEFNRGTIGDVLRVMHGKSQREVEDENGKYPILATGGQIGWADDFIYDKPSVLIGRKGTIDSPQFMDFPFWTIDTLFYTEFKDDNVARYFYYVFLLIDWKKYNEASGVPSLNAKTIEKIEIEYPKPAEQLAIAEFLEDLDIEIMQVEAKLNKYKNIKSGMMNELLTGKIRLV